MSKVMVKFLKEGVVVREDEVESVEEGREVVRGVLKLFLGGCVFDWKVEKFDECCDRGWIEYSRKDEEKLRENESWWLFEDLRKDLVGENFEVEWLWFGYGMFGGSDESNSVDGWLWVVGVEKEGGGG